MVRSMKDKPRVFIGSSSESAKVARLIEQFLKTDSYPTIWYKLFLPGSTYIDDLEEEIDRVDFAVFVCAPDDQLRIRQQEMESPRDNVILELGMALGRLGRRRSFIVHPKAVNLRLPTDLGGVVPVPYDHSEDEDKLEDELRNVCIDISKAMYKRGLRSRPSEDTEPPVLAHLKRKVAERGDGDCLLYSFCGQGPVTAPKTMRGSEAVLRLWADTDGSWIRVEEKEEPPGENHFLVSFQNKDIGYPGNVTFRPNGDQPLDNRPAAAGAQAPPHNAAKRYLGFSIRQVESDKGRLCLAFRLIDRFGSHWAFAKGDTYQMESLDSHSPKTVRLDLAAPTWVLFGADGNWRYAGNEPDFSLVSAVVIEFGGPAKQRPGPGSGVVEVTGFKLAD